MIQGSYPDQVASNPPKQILHLKAKYTQLDAENGSGSDDENEATAWLANFIQGIGTRNLTRK